VNDKKSREGRMKNATTITLRTGFPLLSSAFLSGKGKKDAQKFKNLCQEKVKILKKTKR
jgi:hypothetical protein